jgi:tRNA-dihydrouridine synthase
MINSSNSPLFILAPMDDVTDTVFRQIVAGCSAPDLYFTEFVNVDGLQSPGRPKLLKKLQFVKSEGPLIAQLWGKSPDNFLKTARQIADGSVAKELGLPEGVNFAGVDLNMGCPQKNEVNSGTCSALINDRPLADKIIRATKRGLDGRLPLSVKTRTGFNEVDLSWHEFLLGYDLKMLTVHGRTRKQKSKVPADWEVIGKVRELRDRVASDTLIVGNGDVANRNEGIKLAAKYGLNGIMIGRGIFNDPYAFSKESQWDNYSNTQKIELYRKHILIFKKTWMNNERPIQTLNRFCKLYINGFNGAKELRENFMQAKNINDLLDMIEQTMFKRPAAIVQR